jgi:hypothetical protein
MRPGDRVTGWRDGVPYEAMVVEVLPPDPGCGGGHRHVIVRLNDGTQRETFTDAIRPVP